MRISVYSAFVPIALLLVAGCGSEDRAKGSGFPGGGGVVGGGSFAGLGSGGAAGGGPSGGGGPDDTCEVQTVGTGRVAPDILIVLDRSRSMEQGQRWQPSVAGVKSITSSLQGRIAFGLMTFPSGRSGVGDLTCAVGTVNVPIAENSAGDIARALDGLNADGATPTAVTLQAARAHLQSLNGGPDDRPNPKYVLLVTDGAPNCTGGRFQGDTGTSGSGEPAQVDATVAVIEQMAKDGFKTYVLGYDTQNDATLRDALDRMAQAGGTGDKAHRPVGDEASLVSTFQSITGNVLSCDFLLEEAVADKGRVKVLFDGRQLNVDDANGWSLGGDLRTVSLRGRACASAKEAGHTISVSVQCAPVVPIF